MKEKGKQQRQKGTKGCSSENASSSESVRAKWFCCAFKLGSLQLPYKEFLIFKSNLELALLIFLKEG